jgi:hypothetical protein
MDSILTQTLPQLLHNASIAVTTARVGKSTANIKLCILYRDCICVLLVVININSDYFSKQH